MAISDGGGSNLRVRISADLADIKQGLGLLRGELANVKAAAERTAPDFGRWLKGIDATTAGVARLAGSFIGLRTVVRGLQIFFATLDQLDRLDDLAEKLGISVEALSKLRYAGEAAGTSMDALTTGMLRLSKLMSSAAGGDKGAAAIFKTLGVSVTDAQGRLRGVDEVLQDLAERFASYEDGAGKAALAQEVFGKSGADMIPMLNRGRDGIAGLADEAQRLGAVIDKLNAKSAAEFNDNWTKVKLVAEGATATIAGPLVTAMARVSEAAIEARKNGAGWWTTLQAEADAFYNRGKYGQRAAALARLQPGDENDALSRRLQRERTAAPAIPAKGPEDKPRDPRFIDRAAASTVLAQDTIKRSLAELQHAYEAGDVVARDYFERRVALQRVALDLQEQDLRSQRAGLDAREKWAQQLTDADRKESELARIQEKRTGIEEKLVILGRDRAELASAAARDQAQADQRLAQQVAQFQQGLGGLGDDPFAAEEKRINDSYIRQLDQLDEFRRQRSDLNDHWDLLESKARADHAKALELLEQAKQRTNAQLDDQVAQFRQGLGGVGADPFTAEEKRINDSYIRQLDQLDEFRRQRSDLNDQWDLLETKAREDHAKALELLEQQKLQMVFAQTSQGFASLAAIAQQYGGEQSKTYRALFAASKAFAVAQAAVDLTQNVSKAMSVGYPQNLPLIAAAFAQGAQIASMLAGAQYAEGGRITGPGTGTSDSVPILASNGEYVVRESVVSQPGALRFLEDLNARGPIAVLDWHGRHGYAQGGLVTDVAGATGVGELRLEQARATASGDGVARTPVIRNIIVFDERELANAMEGAATEKVVVNHVRRNRDALNV